MPRYIAINAPIARSFCEGCTWYHLQILVHHFAVVGKADQQVHVVDPTGQGSTHILGMYLFLLKFKLCSCFAVDFILRDFLSS